jgi:hypothetical protein
VHDDESRLLRGSSAAAEIDDPAHVARRGLHGQGTDRLGQSTGVRAGVRREGRPNLSEVQQGLNGCRRVGAAALTFASAL